MLFELYLTHWNSKSLLRLLGRFVVCLKRQVTAGVQETAKLTHGHNTSKSLGPGDAGEVSADIE